MSWGVFMRDDDREIHIVPSTEDGEKRAPHILSLTCSCNPAIDDFNGNIIHEEIQ
jgi:hypothetical protein